MKSTQQQWLMRTKVLSDASLPAHSCEAMTRKLLEKARCEKGHLVLSW